MNILIDTHIFLWSEFTPAKLSSKLRKALKDPGNQIGVSVVTFWEISLKYSLGKLQLGAVKPEELPSIAQSSGYETLPLKTDDVATFYQLPRFTHKDPFDRILIWQALRGQLTFASNDQELADYRAMGLRVFS
jgi:PIN domain nuclease of toxin-antitoxin system